MNYGTSGKFFCRKIIYFYIFLYEKISYKKGLLKNANQLPTGTIIINEEKENNEIPVKVAVYARVSSNENKDNLNRQVERLLLYSNAKGYKVDKVVKEIGSGLNDKRPKLENLLLDRNIAIIVVEHKDRLSRFGLNYIEKLLEMQKRKIEIINNSETDKDDLMQDFVSIITSFTARLYGLRRSKRKTEKLILELEKENDQNIPS
jgi:predicted site-specific integrase-resolvase